MKTYFMSYVNKHGVSYTLRRHGNRMASYIGLYINGELTREYSDRKRKEGQGRLARIGKREISNDQNMVKAAVKTWQELSGRSKIRRYKTRPDTITITLTSGDYNLINKVLTGLEGKVQNEG